MQGKSSIRELIAQLSPRLLRIVPRKLRKQSKALYDIYTDEKNIGDREVALKIGLSGNTFATAKSRLESEIAAIVGRFGRRKSAADSLEQVMHEAVGYLQLGQSDKALKTYLLALSKAEEVENYTKCLEIATTLKLYFANHEDLPPTATEDGYRIKWAELAKAQDELATALRLKTLIGEEKQSAARQHFANICGRESISSLSATVINLRAQLLCKVILRDFDAVLGICTTVRSIVDANPFLLGNPMLLETIVAIQIVHSVSLAKLGQSTEGQKALYGLRTNLQMRQTPIPTRIEYQLLLLQFEIAVDSADKELINDALSSIRAAQIFQSGADAKRFALLICTLSIPLVNLREFGTVLELVGLLVGRKTKLVGAIWLALAGLIELVALFETGQLDHLEAALRRAVRRLQVAGASSGFIQAIKKSFMAQIEGNVSRHDMAVMLLPALEEAKKEKANDQIFEGFDLAAWFSQYL